MKSPDRDAADEHSPQERARVIMWDAAGPFWQEPWYARAVKAVEQELTKQASELTTLRRRVAEMGVIGEIAAERQRQVEVEGWTAEHDDGHKRDEMARAGAWYALSAITHGWTDVQGPQECRLFRDSFYGWPWAMSWWKPKDPRRDLIRAAALIIAEIERSDRLSPPTRKE